MPNFAQVQNREFIPVKVATNTIIVESALLLVILQYVSLITSLLVFSTLDRFRANYQLQAVQCRICPFPVIIQVTIK